MNATDMDKLVQSLPFSSRQILLDKVRQSLNVIPKENIIGKMPTEVLCSIFGNLPASQIPRFRLVCHKWSTVLQQPNLIKRAIQPWEVDTNTIPTWQRLEDVIAFQRGLPKRTKLHKHGYLSQVSDLVEYQDHKLAWVDPDRDSGGKQQLQVLDLDTDKQHTLISTNLVIYRIAVSDSILVAEDVSQRFHVWDLLESPPKSIPSFNFEHRERISGALLVAKRTIIVDRKRKIFRYNVSSGKLTRSVLFEQWVERHIDKYDIRWLMDASGVEIYCLRSSRARHSDESSYFHFTKFDLQGLVLSESTLIHPFPQNNTDAQHYSARVLHGSYPSLVTHLILGPDAHETTSVKVHRLRYDFSEKRLVFDYFTVTGFRSYEAISRMHCWGDSIYCRTYCDYNSPRRPTNLNIIDLQTSCCQVVVKMDPTAKALDHAANQGEDGVKGEDEDEDEEQNQAWINPQIRSLEDVRNALLRSSFLGDFNYMINITELCLIIWRFSEVPESKRRNGCEG